MPGQYIKPTPTSLGQRCMPSLLTCHLHIWQADRGLLRATAVTRGWNGHRIRISTESKLWRTKFFRRPCRESNSQPFDHESGATVQQQAKIKILKRKKRKDVTCASWTGCMVNSVLRKLIDQSLQDGTELV